MMCHRIAQRVFVVILVFSSAPAIQQAQTDATPAFSTADARLLLEAIPAVRSLRRKFPGNCLREDLVIDSPSNACFHLQLICRTPTTARPGPTGVIVSYCVDKTNLDIFENYKMDSPISSASIQKAKESLRRKKRTSNQGGIRR